jgi:hypothetical protein
MSDHGKSPERRSPPSTEAADTISADELRERQRIARELDALRSRTLKPFSADSTLMIRETRDQRGAWLTHRDRRQESQ